MPVEVGTHRNGLRFAKVWFSERGIEATVEGVGGDDDAATEDLEYKLRRLAEMAEDATQAMSAE